MTCVRVPPGSPPQDAVQELVLGYLYLGGRAALCLVHEELPVHRGRGQGRTRGRLGEASQSPTNSLGPSASSWERAVPSALRTSGVSGHFINSSPREEVTPPPGPHHPSQVAQPSDLGHPREGQPGDTATLTAGALDPAERKQGSSLPSTTRRQQFRKTALGGKKKLKTTVFCGK